MSRFEIAIDISSHKRLRDEIIDPFIASFELVPRRLTFDIRAVDEPAHGEQQLALLHGYFEQHLYLPTFITSADKDLIVVLADAAHDDYAERCEAKNRNMEQKYGLHIDRISAHLAQAPPRTRQTLLIQVTRRSG